MRRLSIPPPALWLVSLAVLLLVFPFVHDWPVFGRFISEFRTFNAAMFAVWLLVVLSMNLLTGYSGQISLGHAAVVLVGAYMTGILVDQYSIPMPVSIALAAAFTGLVGGVVIGLPASRLTGPYLAIATFALVITFPQILKLNLIDGWTNGALGIRIREVGAPGLVDGFLDQAQWLYYVTMFVALIMAVLFWNLTHSRFGRAFVALRDSEIGAEQMGINVPMYKALAFGISSFYAGLAGGLFFMVQTFVGPESLGFQQSFLFLVAIVIGGLGTILGSVFGAFFLTFQAEVIDGIPRWAESLEGRVPFVSFVPDLDRLRGVIYGGLLVITVLTFPRGLAGFVQGMGSWRPAAARESLAARLAAVRAGDFGAASMLARQLGLGRPAERGDERHDPPDAGEGRSNGADDDKLG